MPGIGGDHEKRRDLAGTMRQRHRRQHVIEVAVQHHAHDAHVIAEQILQNVELHGRHIGGLGLLFLADLNRRLAARCSGFGHVSPRLDHFSAVALRSVRGLACVWSVRALSSAAVWLSIGHIMIVFTNNCDVNYQVRGTTVASLRKGERISSVIGFALADPHDRAHADPFRLDCHPVSRAPRPLPR